MYNSGIKKIQNQDKKLPKKYRLSIFLFILVLLTVSGFFLVKYIQKNSRYWISDYLLNIRNKNTSAITPDLGEYHPPESGIFNAEDFVHFKLELLNAVNHAVKGTEKEMENLIFIRYNISAPEIEKKIVDAKFLKEVDEYLKNNTDWAKKIKLAEAEAWIKKYKPPYEK